MLAILAAVLALSAPADLALSGVVLSGRPDRSVAVLRSGSHTRVVRVGETAFGGTVLAISADEVVVQFAETRTSVRLPAGVRGLRETPTAAPPPPTLLAEPPPAEDPRTPARDMDRAAVERRLSQEIPRILAETTAVPVTESGQVAGLLLSRIPEGTLLTDAGLRAGDILTRVNDVPIDGMATLVSLWPRLQSETTLQAVVLRNGRPVSLTVTLR